MGIIRATDRDGSFHELEGRERASLMEILKHAGLSVEALCGGCCQCSTCHVYVAEEWLDRLTQPGKFETATLKFMGVEVRDNSRLACQIGWKEHLDGIEVTVAPGD